MLLSENTEIVQGLVTTIIPVYNRPNFLREAVNSVLRQTYRPIEIIIVDDGSNDNTSLVADEYAKRHPVKIRVVHQKNKGPGGARETGRLLAKGEFIQYLDSDDVLLPRKFELQVAGLKDNQDCGVSYGKTRFSRYGDLPANVPWKRTGEEIEFMFPAFLQSRWWGTSSPLYRRNVTDMAGPWLRLCNEEDWEYDCRIASQRVKLHYCNEFVSEQREHSGPRLSRHGSFYQAKLKDRANAHALIYQHARRAGIDHTVPEMQYFARELFLLSRQCGAVGLDYESSKLFYLSKTASGIVRSNEWDFRLYALLARFFGWTKMGKAACLADRFRNK